MPLIKRLLFVSLFAVMLSSTAAAAPHIDPDIRGPKDYVRQKPTEETLRSLHLSPEQIQRIISDPRGAKNVAVILADFPSAGGATNGVIALSPADLSAAEANFNYLVNFYKEASYGALNLAVTYFWNGGHGSSTVGATPYVMPQSIGYYGSNDDSGEGVYLLVRDALARVNAQISVRYPDYDAVLVLHAGYGEESSSNGPDIWSMMVGWSTAYYTFTDGVAVPAREWAAASPRGVICHEFGHILGFPDLYSTSSGGTSVGKWCLMDYGSWVGNGLTPTAPSAWMRKKAGWITPVMLDGKQQVSGIKAYETNPSNTLYQIPILSSSSEYFLVCFTSHSAYNAAAPGEGLAIWHINEGLIDGNSFSERMQSNTVNAYDTKTVDIIPADSVHPRNDPNRGDATDLWPGLKTVFSSPDSDSVAGMASGIALANIVFPGNLASFYSTSIACEPVMRFEKAVGYPNPAGAGYPSRTGSPVGTVLSFSVQLTRPAKTMKLLVYNLAGELVKSAELNDFALNTDVSRDYHWVYQLDWNGRNDVGDEVAPGAYVYRVKADDMVSTGRLAIIR